MHKKQPNILYIFGDHLNPVALSCAGNSDLETPNIDRLAQRGVRYTNAYCTHPLCTPSRASMITGRLPSQLGITGFETDWKKEDLPPTLGRLLRDQGNYRCGWGGKWHISDHSLEDLGPPEPSDQDFGFERICGLDDNHLPEACARFLQVDDPRPFFLVAGFDNPHNICEADRNQPLPWGEVQDVPVDEYPNLPQNFRPSTGEPQVISLRRAQAQNQAVTPYSEERWRRYRHQFYRLIEKVDAQIGQILDALDESGLADDTVVILSSDHGEMNAAHQLFHKQVLYEESVGVPLIVRDPADTRRGVTDDQLVSIGFDLLPTCCDYAGVTPPAGLCGRSLRHEGVDSSSSAREVLIAETRLNNACEARMVRTPRFKYIAHRWGENNEQLFDLEDDPGEMINLAVEKRHANTLQKHRELLAEWCRSTGDAYAKHYTHPGHAAVPGVGWVELSPDRLKV
ncbi:sulfatase family protein [Puniceicoccus vermicola]|uniref:Sulfatase-like hydrolase/transferase n=1 Tax=Puniceicoccus vermicola TaxID=388746 RepID=A0A7X1AZ57_9BACT|nr:sulfatase-like hydrolase/transferase [Puniceicoccus vermicola]MBC2602597.1 sulfatase-like hydrolase/transferase [Puniceicoccus vermicola]